MSRWMVLFAMVIAALLLGCRAAPHRFVLEDPSEPLSLEGQWRFQVGDDPRYADPKFDDSNWRSIQIPGIWRFQGVTTDDFGWYRQTFDRGPLVGQTDLGIEVPYTYYAYEVYVNGQRLDGRYEAPSRRGVLPAGGVNLFRVPKEILKPGDNLIALRTQGGMGYGGVYRGNTRIGTYGVVARALDREIVEQLGISAVCLFIGLYHLLIFINRKEQRLAYLSYSAYAIDLAIFLPAYAGFWYVVFPNHWFNTLAEFGTFSLAIPLIPIFIHALFDLPQARLPRILGAFTALNVAWMLGEAMIRGSLDSFLVYFPAVVVAFLVSTIYSLAVAIRAARKKKPDALLILAGFGFFTVCTTNDVVRYFVLVPGGLRLGHFGFLGFCVAVAIAIGNQYSRMMRNLATLRVNLEKEVAEQTAELRDKNVILSQQTEELRSLDEMKRRFYTNVSHELRTPLTLILGFLRRLRDRFGREEGAKREMDAAERNAAHLLREINDLLDVARLEAGRMKLVAAPVDLAALVREVASNFSPNSAERSRKLVVDVAPTETLFLDFDKVRKIVFNLLSNAFKFTDDERGVVTIRARPRGDMVDLEVEDNGIGIAEDQLAYVFERFRQADGSTTRKYEGTGIGLALVKEIAELHGGRVSVRSTVGKGTTFTVSFKTGRAHLADAEVSADGTVESSGSNAVAELQRLAAPSSSDPKPDIAVAPADAPEVLIVEDHRDLRDYLIALLAKHYRVRSAEDGEQALARIGEKTPDLVVSDVMMPKKDGYELCAAIKTNPKWSHVPVILLTAQAGVQAKVRGLEAQADDYLTKPFHEEELLARAKNLLLLAARGEELREINKKLELRVIEQADALQRRGRLRRFLPPAIADELLAEDAGLALEKKRRMVAVLAAEICDFEALAASIEPEDVTALFGRFHAVTTQAVFRVGGTLVSLHNASLVAVFGAPKELGEREASIAAFSAAREILKEVSELAEAFREIGATRPLVLRGGIDVGHATVGAFGDNEWASFAAIGGPAVRAPRLGEGALPGEVLITRRAAQHIAGTAELQGPEPMRLDSTAQEIFRFRHGTGSAISVRGSERHADPNANTVAGTGDDTPSGSPVVAATVDVAPGSVLGGRYKIAEVLGRGGMGTVYAAADMLLGERIAMKVLHAEPLESRDQAAKRLERLRHEVRLARLVTHPNVSRVFDLQILDGRAALTMELVRGRTLRAILNDGIPATKVSLDWTRQLCDALAAAHACGIVHRDLKPDNVMVEPSGRVVITDFGIARPAPSKEEATTLKSEAAQQVVEGTLDYFAPEQLDPSAQPDARADIYALGVVLFELFTGALPFEDVQAFARLRARLLRPPRDPASIVPAIDPTIRAVLLRCLQKDINERFQRVADVAIALGPAAARQPREAAPQPRISPTPSVEVVEAKPAPVATTGPEGTARPSNAPGAPHEDVDTTVIPRGVARQA